MRHTFSWIAAGLFALAWNAFAAMPAMDWGLDDAARERTATRERKEPKAELAPTVPYRDVADRWGCNPDRFRQW